MSTSSDLIESSVARRMSRRPTRVFKGHTDAVWCVAYFPDGRRVASASHDKTVIVWDVESGMQDGQPLQHHSSVGSIAVSPDGRKIASGTEEGGPVIWDALTREVVHETKGGGVHMLAYSPDGRWIAGVPMDDEKAVWFWDADTGRSGGEPLRCDDEVYCVAFSPDGSRIAIGFTSGSVQVIDIATGKSVVGPIKGHMDWVTSVVYSPDGRLLVTGSANKSIRVWDSKTGVEVGKPMLGHKDDIDCISFTADGRRIASADDGAVRIWDLETRLQVGDPFDADINSRSGVCSVAFSPDGRYVISDNGHNVSLWDTESLEIQGSPTASTQIPPAPIARSIPPLRQHRQAHGKLHNNTSSINSSLLDLPAVVQQQPATQRPQERKPSVVDDWDTEWTRPRLRPTKPQQDPPLPQDTSAVQPAKSGREWSRGIRERWRRIRHRNSRVPEDIPDGLSRPSADEHSIVPVSSEESFGRKAHIYLIFTYAAWPPTNQQPHRERAADTQETAHSRTRSSRNQNEANVALGQADVRLYTAPPRGRKGRRFRARAQRGGVQGNPHSETESEDSDEESEYVDAGCLDVICYWMYARRRRHLQGW